MSQWDSKLREMNSVIMKLDGLSLNPTPTPCTLDQLSFPPCVLVYSFQVVTTLGIKLYAYRLGVELHGSMLAIRT